MSFALTSNFFLNARGLSFLDGGGIAWSFDKNTNVISATASSTAAGANPAAKVGLTAVNGSATTFMRSDGAPPIDQGIVPTWSALHKFTGGLTVTSGGALTIDTFTLALTGNASLNGTNTGDQVIPTAHNPTASVGLSAVNGSATTFMRSDGAPAIDQTITPTWTSSHVFTPSNAASVAVTINGGASAPAGLVINGGANQWGQEIFGVATSAESFGLLIEAGTTSGDTAFEVTNHGGTAVYTRIAGDGSGTLGPSSSSGMSWAATGKFTFSGPIGWNGVSPPVQVTGFGVPTGASVVASFSGTAATNAQMQATIAQILTIMKAHGMIGA